MLYSNFGQRSLLRWRGFELVEFVFLVRVRSNLTRCAQLEMEKLQSGKRRGTTQKGLGGSYPWPTESSLMDQV